MLRHQTCILSFAARGSLRAFGKARYPRNILDAGTVEFKGIPDFTPNRILVPGPQGFPAVTVQPGARAGLFYTPYVQFVVTSPGGLPLLAAGIEVNCPVVAFVNDAPLAPLVPSPIPLPLPHSTDAP